MYGRGNINQINGCKISRKESQFIKKTERMLGVERRMNLEWNWSESQIHSVKFFKERGRETLFRRSEVFLPIHS